MNDYRESNPTPDGVSRADVHARITDAVFALDDEWRFTYLDERAERLLRHDSEELIGEVFWEAFPEAEGSTFQRECERTMETQGRADFEARIPSLDARFAVRAYPSETGLSVYVRDVTDRASRQRRLEKRERALRRAYEVVADRDRSFSEQVDALLGVVNEAVGTEYATLSRVHDDAGTYVFDAVVAPDEADLRAGDTVPLEATNCERVVSTERTLVLNDVAADAPDLAGRTGNAEWGISCYLGAPVIVDGDLYGTFCFYDMEARSEEFSEWEVAFVELLSAWVSAGLERQRQYARLDSFAGMLAHELRNPLQIARIYHAGADDDEVSDALDRIEELVDVMLVIARGEDSAIDRETVELAAAATEAWDDVPADETRLRVETDRTVEADPAHLRHLLVNLFANAVEHGGPDATVRIGDLPGGFYVDDDGSGIPDSERQRVFKAGYTTDETGIGLGLTFVGQLADTYGWECLLTESDEGGARFEFTGVDVGERT